MSRILWNNVPFRFPAAIAAEAVLRLLSKYSESVEEVNVAHDIKLFLSEMITSFIVFIRNTSNFNMPTTTNSWL